jgi:hypothetical protein
MGAFDDFQKSAIIAQLVKVSSNFAIQKHGKNSRSFVRDDRRVGKGVAVGSSGRSLNYDTVRYTNNVTVESSSNPPSSCATSARAAGCTPDFLYISYGIELTIKKHGTHTGIMYV